MIRTYPATSDSNAIVYNSHGFCIANPMWGWPEGPQSSSFPDRETVRARQPHGNPSPYVMADHSGDFFVVFLPDVYHAIESWGGSTVGPNAVVTTESSALRFHEDGVPHNDVVVQESWREEILEAFD